MSVAAKMKRLLIGCFRLSWKMPPCVLTFNYRKSTCVGGEGPSPTLSFLSNPSLTAAAAQRPEEKLHRKQIRGGREKSPSSCLIPEIPSGKRGQWKSQVVDLSLASPALKQLHFYIPRATKERGVEHQVGLFSQPTTTRCRCSQHKKSNQNFHCRNQVFLSNAEKHHHHHHHLGHVTVSHD